MELTKNKEKVQQYREAAAKIISEMTLEEKVEQVLNWAPAIPRLNIKAYNWWNEALHGVARAGVATVFPQAIGLAATFDEDFIEEVADAISTEGRAKYNMQQEYADTDIYKGLTFWSPNVNIFRDPRWGRGHETFGEDPYLTSRLGVRFVEGIQGHDEHYLKAAACAKHFAVHSGPEDIRHSFNAVASLQDMMETYLVAFKACVQEAGVEAIMGAYNRTNGEPCCGSEFLLHKMLRETWGFEGHVVSDCWAIKDFHEGHNVTNSPVESVAMAMNNGCDLNCGNLFRYLGQAVDQGLVKEERLTEALINLYTTRMKLGVLITDETMPKNPFDDIPYSIVDSKPMRELNKEAAAKSVVLLKNEDKLLPLQKDKLKTVGVIGPNANNRKALVGNYEGTASRYVTILEGLQDSLGEDVRVLYSEGCHLCKDRIQNLSSGNDRIAEVRAVCDQSDVVFVCLGLDASLEGEEGDEGNEFASGDKPNLLLPGLQQKVLEAAYESGKPIVLLLLSGSALAVDWADEHIPAILQCWYPGAQGGQAVAEILFGERSPQGKLPVTFYHADTPYPEFTDYSMKNRTYRYMQEEALYPFGYGLSYADFTYRELTCETDVLTEDGVNISAVVENIGEVAGVETTQIYVQVDGESVPNFQLKGIVKVELAPGESKKLSFSLPKEAFGVFNEEGILTYPVGSAKVYFGGQCPDSRSEKLTGKKVQNVTIQM
ncbi:MAG: glycoside hydrolase family 3 C-terminal domain-containing protein [Lachnospiraceae bacterium]|jgi:beta-glucosidase|nr:glycoside hydrolase family 3 C-terminal domain-containing protein [Lachnospiraceae bacterium]